MQNPRVIKRPHMSQPNKPLHSTSLLIPCAFLPLRHMAVLARNRRKPLLHLPHHPWGERFMSNTCCFELSYTITLSKYQKMQLRSQGAGRHVPVYLDAPTPSRGAEPQQAMPCHPKLVHECTQSAPSIAWRKCHTHAPLSKYARSPWAPTHSHG